MNDQADFRVQVFRTRVQIEGPDPRDFVVENVGLRVNTRKIFIGPFDSSDRLDHFILIGRGGFELEDPPPEILHVFLFILERERVGMDMIARREAVA